MPKNGKKMEKIREKEGKLGKKMEKIREKEGKWGRKGKKKKKKKSGRFFHFALLTDGAGYATALACEK